METVRTAEMSWRQVEEVVARGAAAIFPLASTEEHGPHAPTGDYLATDVIAERVAQQSGDVMFPTLPFGYSEYFRHYPGTITLGSETLFRVVEDVVECIIGHGFKHIALFNGHNGNDAILIQLSRKIRRKHGLMVPVVAPFAFAMTPQLVKELYGDNPIGHGAEPMGSIMMHLRPETVQMDRVEDWATREVHGLKPANLNGLRFEGVTIGFPLNMEDITPPSGSLSDPNLASAERGKRIIDESVARLVRFMNWFKNIDSRVEAG
jgi:creatinine amidohydrolase